MPWWKCRSSRSSRGAGDGFNGQPVGQQTAARDEETRKRRRWRVACGAAACVRAVYSPNVQCVHGGCAAAAIPQAGKRACRHPPLHVTRTLPRCPRSTSTTGTEQNSSRAPIRTNSHACAQGVDSHCTPAAEPHCRPHGRRPVCPAGRQKVQRGPAAHQSPPRRPASCSLYASGPRAALQSNFVPRGHWAHRRRRRKLRLLESALHRWQAPAANRWRTHLVGSCSEQGKPLES